MFSSHVQGLSELVGYYRRLSTYPGNCLHLIEIGSRLLELQPAAELTPYGSMNELSRESHISRRLPRRWENEDHGIHAY